MPPVFTLSLAGAEFTRIKWFARHQTMDALADMIGGDVNRPVKNLTELEVPYDFTLAFESEPLAFARAARPTGASPDGAPPATADAGPTIFAAVQEQLGLRLEQTKGPVEMLIVDRVEKVPTEN
jgi:uncharacterized protein (TIGR03435 family)